MRKRYLVASTALIALLATGCGQGDADTAVMDEDVEVIPIAVDLTVPETGEADENIPLSAEVTQGDEQVADAQEVEYEIWEEGKKEDSWMVESEQTEDGIYDGEATFDHDGLFHVQVHVIARDMHTMPISEITIGEGAPEGDASEDAEEHEDHATEGFSMHFMAPDDVKQDEPSAMVVHLQQDDEAMENAKVRLEIVVNDKADEAKWIDLTEDKPGEYTNDVVFDSAGTATVTIHVEDDADLHEHETHDVTISE